MQLDKITSSRYFLPVAVALLVILIGVIYLAVNGSSQTVGIGDTVRVYYTGTLTDGTQFDSNVGQQPLEFTVGSGQLIKGFDTGVVGMKLNETKTITIPASEAYGEYNPSFVIKVPLNSINQTVEVGMQLRASNGAPGVVTAVNDTTASVDFNSPLAGKTLIFSIKVAEIHKKQ
jgi:FKBP-type peptidyl-prolyl cis-trans isomerase 2